MLAPIFCCEFFFFASSRADGAASHGVASHCCAKTPGCTSLQRNTPRCPSSALGSRFFPPMPNPPVALAANQLIFLAITFLCCRKGGLVQRHTAIVSQLWDIMNAAGQRARPEVLLAGRTRLADLLLPHWPGAGPCAVDVAVVHPLVPSAPVHRVKVSRTVPKPSLTWSASSSRNMPSLVETAKSNSSHSCSQLSANLVARASASISIWPRVSARPTQTSTVTWAHCTCNNYKLCSGARWYVAAKSSGV